MVEEIRQLPRHAQRLDQLPPYPFAVIGQRIARMKAEGKDVIRLDVGSPDLPPPEHVIEVLKVSAGDPTHHTYGNYRGDPTFCRAVASYYKRHFGVSLNPDREVLALIGSKEGIVNLSLAYLDRGDVAVVPNLSYPAYEMGALLAGGSVIELPLDPAHSYRPDFAAIESQVTQAGAHAKLLWLNYPNNPTAAVADLALYQEAIDFCRVHHLLLCSDNPYAEVVFDGYSAPSVLQIPGAIDCAVEFMSLSKTYNMAGWRLGACVGNAEAIEQLFDVKSNTDSGHFRPIYDGGTAALNDTPDAWLSARNGIYQHRRDRVLKVLAEMGMRATKSAGSLYVWAHVPEGDQDDQHYCQQALDEALVAITPGQMYGKAGHGYVRISLGVEDRRLDEALARLLAWKHIG